MSDNEQAEPDLGIWCRERGIKVETAPNGRVTLTYLGPPRYQWCQFHGATLREAVGFLQTHQRKDYGLSARRE